MSLTVEDQLDCLLKQIKGAQIDSAVKLRFVNAAWIKLQGLDEARTSIEQCPGSDEVMRVFEENFCEKEEQAAHLFRTEKVEKLKTYVDQKMQQITDEKENFERDMELLKSEHADTQDDIMGAILEAALEHLSSLLTQEKNGHVDQQLADIKISREELSDVPSVCRELAAFVKRLHESIEYLNTAGTSEHAVPEAELQSMMDNMYASLRTSPLRSCRSMVRDTMEEYELHANRLKKLLTNRGEEFCNLFDSPPRAGGKGSSSTRPATSGKSTSRTSLGSSSTGLSEGKSGSGSGSRPRPSLVNSRGNSRKSLKSSKSSASSAASGGSGSGCGPESEDQATSVEGGGGVGLKGGTGTGGGGLGSVSGTRRSCSITVRNKKMPRHVVSARGRRASDSHATVGGSNSFSGSRMDLLDENGIDGVFEDAGEEDEDDPMRGARRNSMAGVSTTRGHGALNGRARRTGSFYVGAGRKSLEGSRRGMETKDAKRFKAALEKERERIRNLHDLGSAEGSSKHQKMKVMRDAKAAANHLTSNGRRTSFDNSKSVLKPMNRFSQGGSQRRLSTDACKEKEHGAGLEKISNNMSCPAVAEEEVSADPASN